MAPTLNDISDITSALALIHCAVCVCVCVCVCVRALVREATTRLRSLLIHCAASTHAHMCEYI